MACGRSIGNRPEALMGDWKILKGDTEVIKHGFVIYTGELDNLALTEQWKKYVGDESMYSTAVLWEIAQKEGYQAKFLTAEEQVEEMIIVDGYEANAWASEPMITQPMAFCWDDKGRMWVAENRDYENRGEGFSGSGDSRILIIEDTDRDGKADKRTVFAEGIPFPSALAVGFGGVFVGAPPNLLFIPDSNQDDKAEMADVKVLLTGWGIQDRHETINSLQWGPDGWLYGLEGFATPSKIHKPVGIGKLYKHNEPFPEDLLEADGVDIDGGVWRYHPIKDRFEVVAHGFSNPWGIDYDAKGRLFISACVIPHLFHVIPGGIYHRQGGQHFNPYVYDDIKTIVDHRHRSAHGGARIYQSDAFSKDQQGRIFMANIHEHAVLSDELNPKGSGFVASHGEDFLLANNAQWVGFSMEIGPEGGLYVLDWHDASICGNEVAHKETGRIYRMTPKVSLAKEWKGRYDDLGQFSDVDLADLQVSPSDWHSRRARLILQYRSASGDIDKNAKGRLIGIYQSATNVDHRLRALWTLHITNSISQNQLEDALDDKDEFIRAWAVQMLAEDNKVSNTALAKFETMAELDPSATVRLN
jgi:putative membrane-bound dehydrogenase-like protein